MKNLLLILISLLSFFDLYSQNADNDSLILKKIRMANKLVLTNDKQRAYNILMECAKNQSGYASNAIGVMKQRGWGTEKDQSASITWFEKAGKLGYYRGYENLSRIYSKAIGVKQDFTKAVYYAKILADKNDDWGQFMVGYYYYKGLGVKQSYETALQYFTQSATKENSNAYFYLGLCYRNGYGIKKNEGEAQFYLNKAVAQGHYLAMQEVAESSPENTAKPKSLKAKGVSSTTENDGTTFRKIERQKIDGHIEGKYVGNVMIYDYSGQFLVRQSTLELTISKTSDNHVNGKWIEADTLVADYEGSVTDTTVQFLKTTYSRTDHYNRKTPVVWNFQQAVLEKTEIDGTVVLAGNIQLYSPVTQEPEKPMFITLQKVKESAEVKMDKSNFCMYPNPFDVTLNMIINLEKTEPIIVNIYSMNGTLMVTQDLGTVPVGRSDFAIDMNIPAGHYAVELLKPSGKICSIIQKK